MYVSGNGHLLPQIQRQCPSKNNDKDFKLAFVSYKGATSFPKTAGRK